MRVILDTPNVQQHILRIWDGDSFLKAMNTEQFLLERYGLLRTLPQLAETLKRSPEGLRITLRTQSEFAAKVNAARLKLGRRVYFRTPDVAKLIDGVRDVND